MSIQLTILNLANSVPLTIFVLVGSLIEDLLMPIPGPFVTAASATIASSQNKTLIYLIFLAMLGAIGKTLGAYLVYFLADKTEDIVSNKFGRILGLSHQKIEQIGKKLDQSKNEILIFFFLRAIPIFPTTPVSAIGGIFRINLLTFLLTAFFGIWIRNFVIIYTVFSGTKLVYKTNFFLTLTGIILILTIGFVLFYKRKQSKKIKQG